MSAPGGGGSDRGASGRGASDRGALPDDDAELAHLSYEEIVSRLETTIEQMSSGDLGIEQVTDLYERAGRLHEVAAQRLERIRDRIDHLTAGDAEP